MLCRQKITQRAAQKMPSETTTACVRLLVFLRIRRSTFPYGVEDDASTISQTPTTHYTSTCVKLTIVTHLSFSERIAIANLSFRCVLHPLPLPLSSCLGCIPPLIGLPSLRFYAVGFSLFLLSLCFCLCSLFYRDDVLCWLLLVRPFLSAFHAHLRFPV